MSAVSCPVMYPTNFYLRQPPLVSLKYLVLITVHTIVGTFDNVSTTQHKEKATRRFSVMIASFLTVCISEKQNIKFSNHWKTVDIQRRYHINFISLDIWCCMCKADKIEHIKSQFGWIFKSKSQCKLLSQCDHLFYQWVTTTCTT